VAGYGPDGRGNLGVGLMAGSPTGLSLKYDQSSNALDGGSRLGFNDGVTLTMDYLLARLIRHLNSRTI